MTHEVTMIDDCQDRDGHLTNWERGFLDSIKARLERNEALSTKQAEHLEAIWSRVTSVQPSTFKGKR